MRDLVKGNSSITKAQWLAVEEELQNIYCKVEFSIDDQVAHVISVERRKVAEGKYQLVAFIDGSFNFSWGWPESDQYRAITEKVWRQRQASIYKPSDIKKFEKQFGKRKVKKHFPSCHEKRIWREPIFTTAKSLVRQYCKIEGLTLVTAGNMLEKSA